MLMTRFVGGIVSVAMIVLGASVVTGQDYPNKPIRIVASSAGGGGDFTARLIAQGIAGPLGQQVLVENRGGVAQGEIVAKASPDGYTLLAAGGSFIIGPLMRKAPYDPVRDFSPITLALREPNILVVTSSLPVKSVKELVALAKARPGELNYAFGSVGGSGQIAAELFKSLTGVKIVGVPYKSDSQEITDLISGYTQLTFQDGGKVAPHIKSGKMRALAVGGAKPSALFPGLPTVAATLPGFESGSMTGVFAPAKTPAAIINRLNQEIVRVLNQADVKQKLSASGLEVVGSSPEELGSVVSSEITRVSKMIKDGSIKVE